MKIFNNIEQFNKHVQGNSFNYDGNISIEFDLIFDGSIAVEGDINAARITARNIKGRDLAALDVKANNISFREVSTWDLYVKNYAKAEKAHCCDVSGGRFEFKSLRAGDVVVDKLKVDGKIDYYQRCIAKNGISCKEISGRTDNAAHSYVKFSNQHER